MRSRASEAFVLLLVFLISGAYCGDGTLSFDIPTSEGPIADALYNFTITLPSVTVDVESLGGTLTVSNLTCSQIILDGIRGTLGPAGDTEVIINGGEAVELATLDVTAYGLSLDCAGLFSYFVNPLLQGDGTLTLGLGNETALSLDLTLASGYFPLNGTNTTMGLPPASAFAYSSPEHQLQFAEMVAANLKQALPSAMLGSLSNAAYAGTKRTSAPIDSGTDRKLALLTDSLRKAERVADVDDDGGDDDDNADVPDGPPSLALLNEGCAMNVSVSYLTVSDPFLRPFTNQIIDLVEDILPDIVCGVVAGLIDNVLDPLLNDLALTVYNGLLELENQPQDQIFNQVGFFWAFVGATILWVAMIIFYLCLPYALREYKKRQGVVIDPEKAPLTGLEPDEGVMSEGDVAFALGLSGAKDSVNGSGGEHTHTHHYAIIQHPKLHWFWKYAILGTILYDIALFSSATISIAASVYVYLTIGGVQHKLPSVYSFRLVSSVIEMWEAGVWPLALLIGGLSGVWPYVKLSLMFFAWIAPTKILSVKWRLHLLRLLDILGKWSLIDAFVLVLFVVSFRVHIGIGEGSQGGILFDMVVDSQYGYYSYLVATMISLAMSHIIIFIHEYLEEPKVPKTSSEYLHAHPFAISDRTASVTYLGTATVMGVLLLTGAAVIAGSIVDAFAFTYEGSLIGVLLDATTGENSQSYSVLSLVPAIPEATLNDPNNLGIRVIQISYLFFAFLLPLALLVALAAIWLVPLTSRLQKVFFIVVEILSAWSAVDVFIVAVIVALFELQQFAEFVVDGKCDQLDTFLAVLLPLTPDGDPVTCFTVKATLNSGSWILLFTVIVLFTVGYSLTAVCNKAIHERVQRELGTLDEDSDVELDEDGHVKVNPVSMAVSTVSLYTAMGLNALRCVTLSNPLGDFGMDIEYEAVEKAKYEKFD